MLARDILYEADGLLSLGARGEQLYGRKNFFELYAVFTAPPVMRVRHGRVRRGTGWRGDGGAGGGPLRPLRTTSEIASIKGMSCRFGE